MWNMLQLTFVCVNNFSFILLPTGSPLTILGQFWPLLPSPGLTKRCLTAKSSLQHSIHIFRKSHKKLATFSLSIFRGTTYIREGGRPPPAFNRVKFTFCLLFQSCCFAKYLRYTLLVGWVNSTAIILLSVSEYQWVIVLQLSQTEIILPTWSKNNVYVSDVPFWQP